MVVAWKVLPLANPNGVMAWLGLRRIDFKNLHTLQGQVPPDQIDHLFEQEIGRNYQEVSPLWVVMLGLNDSSWHLVFKINTV